jgi:hypothetical protein
VRGGAQRAGARLHGAAALRSRLAESERALQLNPNDAEVLAARAAVLLWTGDIEGSIAAGELAMRLNGNLGPSRAQSRHRLLLSAAMPTR